MVDTALAQLTGMAAPAQDRPEGWSADDARNFEQMMTRLYDADRLTPEQRAAYERNTGVTPQPTGPPVPFAPAGGLPEYGLPGAESAIRTGLGSSLAALDTATERGAGALTDAQAGFDPYTTGGGQAAELMAAMTGAAGPEAQARAYEAYQSSPGYQFMFDEAMRATRANAAAGGGRGGGRVLTALQDRAAGLASQDFNNNFSRLAATAGQGLQGQGMRGNLASTLANLYSNAGNTAVNAFTGAGNNIANMRYGTGRDIANMTYGTANANAADTSQYGVNLNNLYNTTGTNISNLLTGGSLANAGQLSQLATILANLSQNQGSNQAVIDAGLGRAEAAGIVDSAAGARSGINDLLGLIGIGQPNISGTGRSA